jgi:hypothetical protein
MPCKIEPDDRMREIMADKDHAQILIELHSADTLMEARTVIEKEGARVLETSRISDKWGLIKLDVIDMRYIALKLAEHGFFLRGINASP